MRYYLLEMRAIQGLVQACAPAKLGPKGSPDRQAQLLRKQVAQLERECARYAALARVAQRAVNLSAPAANQKAGAGEKVRRHKPQVRAVKLLARLQASLQENGAEGAQLASQPQAVSAP